MGIDNVLPLVSLVLFVSVLGARGTRTLSARQGAVGLGAVLLALLWADLAHWSQDPGPAWASWTVDGESIQLVREGLFGRLPVVGTSASVLIGGSAFLLSMAVFIGGSALQQAELSAHAFTTLIAPSKRGMRRLSALRSGASGTPHGPPLTQCILGAA